MSARGSIWIDSMPIDRCIHWDADRVSIGRISIRNVADFNLIILAGVVHGKLVF